MADTLDREHFDAFLSLLRADSTLSLFPDAEGFTPTGTPAPPYIRAYFWIERSPNAPGNSLNGRSQSWTAYFNLHCVGENEYSAAAMQMRAARLVLDQRPTVTGRLCGLIREDQCLPPTRDADAGRDIFDGVSIYRFTSN